jgi:Sec-independent protein secretion pathway component TatC
MSEQGPELRVLERLAELRRRIIWVLAVFVAALVAGFIVAGPVIQYGLSHRASVRRKEKLQALLLSQRSCCS